MNINPTEQLILESFNEVQGKPLMTWDLVSMTSKGYPYIKQCLWMLQKKGVIKSVKRGRQVFYYPNPDYFKEE